MADSIQTDTTRAQSKSDAPALNVAWLNGLLTLIASGITLEQFFRRVSEELRYPYGIASIQIFGFDREGHLARLNEFGDGAMTEAQRLLRDQLHPVTDCARTEEALAIADQREFELRYPQLTGIEGPALFVPLRLGPLVDGVFAITFDKKHSIDWNVDTQLHEALLSVAHLAHLIKLKSPHLANTSAPSAESEVSLGLSDRQLVIARMIAQGMTNRSIARELGFSEATIRYETIKLYERLRVKNRSHAAARIHQLGIG